MVPRLKISGGACILLALMLLVLPLQWIMAAVLAACFHELCHYGAIRFCCRESPGLHVFSFGARLPLPPMSRKKELLCALAGPLGGLLLLSVARWLPRTAVCAAIQSAYNMLPVYPMDGGRAISCVFQMLLPPPKAQKMCQITENICLGSMAAIGLYALIFLNLGFLPLLLACFLILKLKITKMPCKVPRKRVQ